MKIPVPALRWQFVGALVGAVLLASAPAASAAASSEAAPRQAPTAREGGTSSGPLAHYRGIQGGNLCLLARCTVGESAPGGAGPSNTQGFNLCLLALCTVRP